MGSEITVESPLIGSCGDGGLECGRCLISLCDDCNLFFPEIACSALWEVGNARLEWESRLKGTVSLLLGAAVIVMLLSGTNVGEWSPTGTKCARRSGLLAFFIVPASVGWIIIVSIKSAAVVGISPHRDSRTVIPAQ